MNERVALYVDPPSAALRQDRFFDLSTGLFHSSLARCFSHLRDVLRAEGVAVHTADRLVAQPLDGRNLYVSVGMLENYGRLSKRPDTRLSAFFVTESPIVEPRLFKGLADARHHFARIYSCCDGGSLEPFVGSPLDTRPLRWPVDFEGVDQPLWENTDRRFLVMVNMNKLPRIYWNELFTARMRAVEFFSRTGEIDLYGVGWDKPSVRLGHTWVPWTLRRIGLKLDELRDHVRPDPLLVAARRVYKGQLATKWETLSRYTFTLCFENTILKGWLTEKIFECFRVGTIPIYWGATDVEELIPSECFIDMRRFAGYRELRDFLRSLGDDEVRRYRECGREFLRSDRFRPFTKDAFVDIFRRILQEDAGLALTAR